MAVTTVLGPVDADALGVTLPHEHLLTDLRNQFADFADPERQRVALAPLDENSLPLVRKDPYAVRDNLLLDDVDLACEELGFFRQAGGQTVVECTSQGLAPQPRKLREIAERTGLNIIAGCGFYTQDTHPDELGTWSVQETAEKMVRDLTEGIGDTDVRAGVIGEIGLSSPIHPDERKCLLAAAEAAVATEAPIYVHTYPWGREGTEAARLLLDAGAEPAKVVICHVDVDFDAGYLRGMLDLGVFVEFDNFGKAFSPEPAEDGFAGGAFATDGERVQMARAVFDWGCGEQLLITNDICLKCMLRRYGGRGYAYILEGVVPMLLDAGIEQKDVNVLLVANARRLLAA